MRQSRSDENWVPANAKATTTARRRSLPIAKKTDIHGDRQCYGIGSTSGPIDNLCSGSTFVCGQGYLKVPVSGVPTASPTAVRALNDEEIEDEDEDAFVNARLQLSSPVPPPDHLPAASQFVDSLAQRAGVPSSHVLADVALVGSGRPSAIKPAVAHLHVTVYAENRTQADAITEALRRTSGVQAASTNFTVGAVNVFPSTAHPMVCALTLLRRKSESRDQLVRLMELQEMEVELLRGAMSSVAEKQTTCSANALRMLEDRLDVGLSSPR